MDLLGSDISLDDVKNVPDSPEYSLSAILAEYGEAPAAASGVEARSREIVMEALGETISGAVRAEDAEGTEGLPPPPPRERAQKERSRRKKRQKHRSARPAAEDTYREEGAQPEQPPAPEPVSAPEPPESARTYEPAAEDTYEPERTYTPRAGRAYDPGPVPAAGRPYGQRRGAGAAVPAGEGDDGGGRGYRPGHAPPGLTTSPL